MNCISSDTGKVVIGCFFDVFMKCQALLNMVGSDSSTGGSGDMTSMLPFNITEVMGAGGLDVYCDLMTGNHSVYSIEFKGILCVVKLKV